MRAVRHGCVDLWENLQEDKRTATFKDHFSPQAREYLRYRPAYPAELFQYVAGLVSRRSRAWDSGTGNGQAAVALALHFDEVIATDASPEQIANAQPHNRVSYRVRHAEDSGIEDGSVDLVIAAQSLHWFDMMRFYEEVRRVTRPGAALAVWCYKWLCVTPAVDAVMEHLYSGTLEGCWPPERQLVADGYSAVPFPFNELKAPSFQMEAEWTLTQLLGYIETWSAVRYYRAQRNADPVAPIVEPLTEAWGNRETGKQVSWPIEMRVGRVHTRR